MVAWGAAGNGLDDAPAPSTRLAPTPSWAIIGPSRRSDGFPRQDWTGSDRCFCPPPELKPAG